MPTLYSYIRFSTKSQADGDSLNRQTTGARQYAHQHGYQYSDQSFADLGISGFSGKRRPELDQMFECISNGTIKAGDAIYLDAIDRLSRQGYDHCYQLIRSILLADVLLIAENMVLNRASLNDLVSIIRIATSASLAHDESKRKSVRIRAAKASQREQSKQGIPVNRRLPYWLKGNAQTGYSFGTGVDVVRLIVSMRLDGKGIHQVASALNAGGYPTRYNKGSGWSYSTVCDIVRNVSLYGAYRMVTGEVVHDYYPALISFAEWQRIQTIDTAGAGIRKHGNPLARLLRCHHCDGTMSIKVMSRKLASGECRLYRTWECNGVKAGKCSVRGAYVDLDRAVFSAIRHLKVMPVSTGNDARRATLTHQIEQLRIRRSDIEAEMDNATGGAVGALSRAYSSVEGQIAALEKELTGLSPVLVDVQLLTSLVDDAERFNVEARRMIDRVVVRYANGNRYHLRIHQRNGHIVHVTAWRNGQRKPWNYTHLASEVLERLSDGVDDDSDLNDELSQ